MKSGQIYEALKKKKWRDAVGLLTPLVNDNPDIAYLIGLIHWDFADTVEGRDQSFKWFHLAAKSGHLNAKVNLALHYEQGNGVGKNMARARRLYEECAADGSCTAMYSLSEMYLEGRGGPVNGKQAVELLLKAANDPKGGHIATTLNLCDFDSLADFHLAAERDVVAVAQAYLGILAMDGIASFPKNYVNAAYWLKKAFDNGDVDSGETLVKLYLKRLEPLKAQAILEKLDLKKNRKAWFSLAELLQTKSGSAPELVKHAFQQAHEAGHPKAIKGLEAYKKSLSYKARAEAEAEEERLREEAKGRYRYLDPTGIFSSDHWPEKAIGQFIAADSININSEDTWELKMAARGYMASFHNGYEEAAEGIEKILKLLGPDRFRELMVPDA